MANSNNALAAIVAVIVVVAGCAAVVVCNSDNSSSALTGEYKLIDATELDYDGNVEWQQPTSQQILASNTVVHVNEIKDGFIKGTWSISDLISSSFYGVIDSNGHVKLTSTFDFLDEGQYSGNADGILSEGVLTVSIITYAVDGSSVGAYHYMFAKDSGLHVHKTVVPLLSAGTTYKAFEYKTYIDGSSQVYDAGFTKLVVNDVRDGVYVMTAYMNGVKGTFIAVQTDDGYIKGIATNPSLGGSSVTEIAITVNGGYIAVGMSGLANGVHCVTYSYMSQNGKAVSVKSASAFDGNYSVAINESVNGKISSSTELAKMTFVYGSIATIATSESPLGTSFLVLPFHGKFLTFASYNLSDDSESSCYLLEYTGVASNAREVDGNYIGFSDDCQHLIVSNAVMKRLLTA